MLSRLPHVRMLTESSLVDGRQGSPLYYSASPDSFSARHPPSSEMAFPYPIFCKLPLRLTYRRGVP